MNTPDNVVQRLLEYLESRIDLSHIDQMRDRHLATIHYEETARLPLMCYLPYEGEDFQPYPYLEAFADPAKMMVNELLVGRTSIYHAVDFRDDTPYCLRANLGIGIVASMFGAQIQLVENNMPWVVPLGFETIKRIVDEPTPDPRSGLGQRVVDQFDYFEAALSDYPRCKAAFELTSPDLQGPFDIAVSLWGSSIFTEIYDDKGLVQALLSRVTDAIIAAYHLFADRVREHTGPHCNYHHSAVQGGRLLIKNDSVINISAGMYREVVQSFDSRLAEALGGISIHFCGNGEHQIDNFISVRDARGIDLGQPELNDLDFIYRKAAPRRIPVVRASVPQQELTAGLLKGRYPVGVSLVYRPESLEEAHDVWERYSGSG